MLNAETYEHDDTHALPGLRYQFNSASAADTRAIGAAFAHVVRDHAARFATAPALFHLANLFREAGTPPVKRVLRIGLLAEQCGGKSTFAKGLLDEIRDKTLAEKPLMRTPREQGVWHSRQAGWIRHYDTMVSLEPARLASYWKDRTAHCLPTRVDIVEHAAEDMHSTRFDYLVFINWGEPMQRRITVVADPALAGSHGLDRFLGAARPFRFPAG
jgi:hypothetical protein